MHGEARGAIHATRHFEFFWLPAKDSCFMKTLDPTERESIRCRTERVSASTGAIGVPSERNVKFNEIEFSMAPSTARLLAALRALLLGPIAAWSSGRSSTEVAQDDIYLSPALGRRTVSISAHQGAELPHEPFFREVEAIFRSHGARPHWGKWHTHGATELHALYPRWDDFQRVRRRSIQSVSQRVSRGLFDD